MSRHLQRDLDELKEELLQLGDMVETAINNSLIALNDRRPELAEALIKEEKLVDEKEVHIEEECLKILALHQPVAMDLRFIVVVLKVNNDLERMGDMASKIAKRSLLLSSEDPIPTLPEFREVMPDYIRTMVKNSLEAMIKLDLEMAREVIEMDNTVDEINRQMYEAFHQQVIADPNTTQRALATLSVSRYLERIADLATNVAEDVIFMIDGEVIRHQKLV
ncbi:MAG: phosphate transport system regulatory protein PhoU [Planctomycetes bacterium]|nr:phosphate transport system regulatory protein PhoU [Planctomycetota bacterium]|tara:strand:- start:1083 stop:1745 length:663 start_codon:yes stop_codon:yes gene_type:complete